MRTVLLEVWFMRKFPSLADTLDEIRRMYQYEQDRFQKIEDKATSFLTLNSIILTIINVFSDKSPIFIPTSIFLIVTIFYCFKVHDLRHAKKPNVRYDDFYKYAKMAKEKLSDQFLLNYVGSATKEEEVNEDKLKSLKEVIRFSKLAWLSFVIALILLKLNYP